MYCRVICFCLAATAMASTALGKTDELLLDKEKVHALIRETAAKIEEKYKGTRPEADTLLQRVEEALTAVEPTRPDKSDRQRMLASKLQLVDPEITFTSGFEHVSGGSIRLDPFRPRTQDLLTLMCSGSVSKDWDPQAMAALRRMLLVLQPGVPTRRFWAASAASLLHDWPEVHRQLDICLKESPDNVALISQKAATILLESPSKKAQKKAEFYSNKIEALMEKNYENISVADMQLVARNEYITLLISGNNSEAREGLAMFKEQEVFDEKECKRLEKLLP